MTEDSAIFAKIQTAYVSTPKGNALSSLDGGPIDGPYFLQYTCSVLVHFQAKRRVTSPQDGYGHLVRH